MILGKSTAPAHANPADSARRDRIGGTALFGWSALALFFGLLWLWADLAPLNGAVVADAVVSVDGNRKTVQHLDGGIIKELLVKEGDHVKAGQTLIVLDGSQAQAEFDILDRSYILYRVMEERIRAEARGESTFPLPPELDDRRNNGVLESIVESQQVHLRIGIEATKARQNVIKEKIGQLESKMEGDQSRRATTIRQLKLIRAEYELLIPLMEKGLITRDKMLRTEQQLVASEGNLTVVETDISTARVAIAEQNRSIAQIDADRLAQLSDNLRETQAKLLEILPKLNNARQILERINIRSPYTGQIVGLNTFSLGGVIGRGDRILDVVPDEDRLVITAQVSVGDISELAPGMVARVRLASHDQKRLPPLNAYVKQISADRLTDKNSGKPYYLVELRLDSGSLDKNRDLRLYAGMAATMIVTTKERTAFNYLLGPLTTSFDRAFNQL